jgi:hypothetical protein
MVTRVFVFIDRVINERKIIAYYLHNLIEDKKKRKDYHL